MVVALWIAFGMLVGGLAGLLSPSARRPRAVAGMMALAVVGALMGGYGGRVAGLYPSIRSGGALAMAAAGAIILLAVYNAVFARRTVAD